MNQLVVKEKLGKKFLLGSAALVPVASFAAGPDLSSLTSAIDFSTVITGVLAVAVLVIGVILAIKGTQFIINMVRKS